MKSKNRISYIILFFAVFFIEVFIALFIRDSFIRPYVGDMLVTVLICLFFRAFLPFKTKLLPLYVFFFAFAVEVGQYFDFVRLLGLENNRFISVLLGRTFSLADIICYGVGCVAFWALEMLFSEKHSKSL